MAFFTATYTHYRDLLHHLCPPGDLWKANQASDRRWDKLMNALGMEFARLHNRVLDLFMEMDWRTTTEMIDAWERVAGLPNPHAPVPTAIADRRLALHAKMTAQGGCTTEYYIEIADNLGVTITIVEIGGTYIAWHDYLIFRAPSEIHCFRVGRDKVGHTPLRSWTTLGKRLYWQEMDIKQSHTIYVWTD